MPQSALPWNVSVPKLGRLSFDTLENFGRLLKSNHEGLMSLAERAEEKSERTNIANTLFQTGSTEVQNLNVSRAWDRENIENIRVLCDLQHVVRWISGIYKIALSVRLTEKFQLPTFLGLSPTQRTAYSEFLEHFESGLLMEVFQDCQEFVPSNLDALLKILKDPIVCSLAHEQKTANWEQRRVLRKNETKVDKSLGGVVWFEILSAHE